jgi:hypothetical protein
VIPATSLAPESAQRPKKTSWLSSRGWAPSFVDEEEIVATLAAAMSSHWWQQECAVENSKRAGRGEEEKEFVSCQFEPNFYKKHLFLISQILNFCLI